jgi:hypothetical protein
MIKWVLVLASFAILLGWVVGNKIRPEVEREMLEMDDVRDE